MSKVHVNVARPDRAAIARIQCDCTERDSHSYHPRFLCEHYPWYGFTFTCLRCGEVWHDDERAPRPLLRGWRQRNINRARRRMRLLYLPDLKEGKCFKVDSETLIEIVYPENEVRSMYKDS